MPGTTETPDRAEARRIAEVMRKWADKAEQVYDDRTAGDHTWIGLLAEFAQELAPGFLNGTGWPNKGRCPVCLKTYAMEAER